MANKPATHCRYCGQGGDLYKGTHRACKNEAVRRWKLEQKLKSNNGEPNKCRRCGVVIGDRFKLCADCGAVARKEAYKRYEEKRNQRKLCACGCSGELPRGFTGRFLAGHNPRLNQPRVRVRRRSVAQKDATTKARADFNRERPFAEPMRKVRPLEGVIITPPHVTVTRVPAQGAAALSLREYRRIG